MVKEEWRLHQSMVGAIGSGLFPAMIFFFTAFLAYVSKFLLWNVKIQTILLFLHMASVFYGLFVGGFGEIGEHVMTRRLGQLNMLLQLPQLYPISFKEMMAIFFVKDTVYYVLYSFVPMVAGLMVVAPQVGVTYQGVATLGVTMFLAFLMGMGVSFLNSALSSWKKPFSWMFRVFIVGAILMYKPLGVLSLDYLIPPLGYWTTRNLHFLSATYILSIILTTLALMVTKEKYETREESYADALGDTSEQFGFMGGLSTIVAKEWLELSRSGTLKPIVFGFLGHLVALYLGVWIFESGLGLPINFNVVFYSGFIGFMGITTYSWLTNLEHNEYLNVQPVNVVQVIKAKLSLYFILTTGLSALYVVIIALIRNEAAFISPALVVSLGTTTYIAAVTTYLTGIWTNTMFFDARVLLKFSVMVVPPLTLLEILSFYNGHPFVPAAFYEVIVSGFLVVCSVFLFRRLDKWRNTPFSFVYNK
jgi:hypothetical protein